METIRQTGNKTQASASLDGGSVEDRNIHNVSQKGRPEQVDRREAPSESTMEFQHGHKSALLRELRDTMSCAKSEQQARSHKETKHQSHLGKV